MVAVAALSRNASRLWRGLARRSALALLALCSAPALGEPIYLSGQIGGTPVMAAVDRQEGALTGWYLYPLVGQQILLSGTLAGERFDLLADLGDGRTERFEGEIGEAGWTGSWSGAGRKAPFALRPLGALPNANQTIQCTATRREGPYTYRSSLRMRLAKGRIAGFSASDRATGADGDEQGCEVGLADLAPLPTRAGLALASEAGTAAGGCIVRIVGDERHLYVKMGDAAAGADCREAGDTRFCSPRGFWSDRIVDRKTGRCRAVR